MKKLRVATNPLTNVIYAGTTKTDKRTAQELWSADKQDVTMDCLIAVIEHCLKFGDTVQITKQDGTPEFEIDVRDLR